MPLVPCLMLLMTLRAHPHQPWRLDGCKNSLTREGDSSSMFKHLMV